MTIPRTPVSQSEDQQSGRVTRNSGQPLFQGGLPPNLPRGRPFGGAENRTVERRDDPQGSREATDEVTDTQPIPPNIRSTINRLDSSTSGGTVVQVTSTPVTLVMPVTCTESDSLVVQGTQGNEDISVGAMGRGVASTQAQSLPELGHASGNLQFIQERAQLSNPGSLQGAATTQSQIMTTSANLPLPFHIREDTLSRQSSFASPAAIQRNLAHQQNMLGFVESQAYSDIDSNPVGRVLRAITPSHDTSEHAMATRVRQLTNHLEEIDNTTGIPIIQRFRLLQEVREEVVKAITLCKGMNFPKFVPTLAELRERATDRIKVIDQNPQGLVFPPSADSSLVVSEAVGHPLRPVVTPDPSCPFINAEDDIRSSSRISERRPPQADRYANKVRHLDDKVRKHEDYFKNISNEFAHIRTSIEQLNSDASEHRKNVVCRQDLTEVLSRLDRLEANHNSLLHQNTEIEKNLLGHDRLFEELFKDVYTQAIGNAPQNLPIVSTSFQLNDFRHPPSRRNTACTEQVFICTQAPIQSFSSAVSVLNTQGGRPIMSIPQLYPPMGQNSCAEQVVHLGNYPLSTAYPSTTLSVGPVTGLHVQSTGLSAIPMLPPGHVSLYNGSQVGYQSRPPVPQFRSGGASQLHEPQAELRVSQIMPGALPPRSSVPRVPQPGTLLPPDSLVPHPQSRACTSQDLAHSSAYQGAHQDIQQEYPDQSANYPGVVTQRLAHLEEGVAVPTITSEVSHISQASSYPHPCLTPHASQPFIDRAEGVQQNSHHTYLQTMEQQISSKAQQLTAKLHPRIDSDLSRSKISSLSKEISPQIANDVLNLERVIDRYLSKSNSQASQNIVDLAIVAIDKAQKWRFDLSRLYVDLDCMNQGLDIKLFSNIGKFTEDSAISIYEFLARFDQITNDKGSKQERAHLLYREHLDKAVQDLCYEYRGDMDRLKGCLIDRFGEPRVMVTNILKKLKGKSPPDDSHPSKQLTEHYRSLHTALKRIQELTKIAPNSRSELESYTHSTEFLENMARLLPSQANNKFFQKLSKYGLKVRNIHGSLTYAELERVVSEFTSTTEGQFLANPQGYSAKQKPPPKDRINQVITQTLPPQITDQSTSSLQSSTQDFCNTLTQGHGQGNPNKVTKGGQSKPIRFPCPIEGHDHSINLCDEFMTATPTLRIQMAKGKTCFKCLGPFENCKRSSCQVSVPSDILCSQCKVYFKFPKQPRSFLFCTDPNHKEDLALDTFTALLEKYLNCKQGKLQGKVNVNLAHMIMHTKCNTCNVKVCSCIPKTLTRAPCKSQPTPCINSQSGYDELVPSNKIKKMDANDSFFVTQVLNLNGRDVLTFYDSGANHNLVSGELAEEIDLKILTDVPSQIGVAGGEIIWTKYGSYRFNVGPTEEGDYIQINAQGIQRVTDKFNKYVLDDINKEVEQSSKLSKDEVLPKYIGGAEARLLIGISTCALEPQLLFRLSSGLGVYRSQIPDKWGSRICYGGPHSSFTKTNKELGRNINHLRVHFRSIMSEYYESPNIKLSRELGPEYEEQLPGFLITKPQVFPGSLEPLARNISPFVTDHLISEGTHQNDGDVECSGAVPLGFDQRRCIHPCGHARPKEVHKAKIPVSQLKGYLDEMDLDQRFSPRCERCKLCESCGTTAKTRMISLQEQYEQEAIEESVSLDLTNERVVVTLPFIKDPVPFLTKRHGGNSNYRQALRMFQGMCRKPDSIKQSLVKVQKDLVDRGFMKRVCDLSKDQQKIISESGFKHYMPWNVAHKPDSQSTPHRITVDASVTGLNQILAKGRNTISQIPDILIRNRCKAHAWASDVTKLYNMLHLHDAAIPYGLFLFNSNLAPNSKPEVYCMLVAWYRVSPTGNQANAALQKLSKSLSHIYPSVESIVEKDLYVDDMFSSDPDKGNRDSTIDQTRNCFSKGGFALKYVVKSKEPIESDDKITRVLGYAWDSEEDKLYCGFKELNFQKKKRGARPLNRFPVDSQQKIDELLKDTVITRRVVVGKLAELYDPVGLWEAYKIQLKLDNTQLNDLDWDEPLNQELAQSWKHRFYEYLQLGSLYSNRCIVPEDAVDPSKVRILCTADAAQNAGGSAIYAGFLRSNGQYSNTLLTAKSRIMSNSIPRNELESIRIMSNLACMVQKSLGDLVDEIYYFTDSTVALCWCCNTGIKLRVFTRYRVEEIRKNILKENFIMGDMAEKLFHIDGLNNPADLVTKQNNITPDDLSPTSIWQSGFPWMNEHKSHFPVTKFTDLTVSKTAEEEIQIECFPDAILTGHHIAETHPHSEHCHGCPEHYPVTPMDMCYGKHDYLPSHCDNCTCVVDLTKETFLNSPKSVNYGNFNSSLSPPKKGEGHHGFEKCHIYDLIRNGWKRSINVYSKIFKFILTIKHRLHLKKGIQDSKCRICTLDKDGVPQIELEKLFADEALAYILSLESDIILKTLSKKQLESFVVSDGKVFYESRLISETKTKDLDPELIPFFDNFQTKELLPVIRADSDVFFSLAMYIHLHVVPHGGIESTLREISKIAWPINNPRKYLQRIRRDCTHCRRIRRITAELRMMPHNEARNTIAPPFYAVQMDTVFGFHALIHQRARKTVKVYALIICCLFTGATNILLIESLSTRNVLQALDRHAMRYGVPAIAHVDNGSQLIALKNVSFQVNEFGAIAYDSLGIQIRVSNPKSHEERGRIESRVRLMRSMMSKLAIGANYSFSFMEWETVFAKISNSLNNLPIARPDKSTASNPTWDMITPNRLILGRNNNRAMSGWFSLNSGVDYQSLVRKNKEILKFWYSIFLEHIHLLIPRPNKWLRTDEVQVNDVVLFLFSESPSSKAEKWRLGIVREVKKKNSLLIEYSDGIHKRTLTRSPRDLSIIVANGELEVNTTDYFKSLTQ